METESGGGGSETETVPSCVSCAMCSPLLFNKSQNVMLIGVVPKAIALKVKVTREPLPSTPGTGPKIGSCFSSLLQPFDCEKANCHTLSFHPHVPSRLNATL